MISLLDEIAFLFDLFDLFAFFVELWTSKGYWLLAFALLLLLVSRVWGAPR